MIRLKRTDANNGDFRKFVKSLDAYLAEIDGTEHAFYAVFNGLEEIHHVVIAYNGSLPTGCGAIKPFDQSTMEVKRMFTDIRFRGQGVASLVLEELENWSLNLGYKRCVLETGKRMPEAVAFYKKMGYVQIPNFGPYEGVANSICFEKRLETP